MSLMEILHQRVPTANTHTQGIVLGLQSSTGASGTSVSTSAQHFHQ